MLEQKAKAGLIIPATSIAAISSLLVLLLLLLRLLGLPKSYFYVAAA